MSQIVAITEARLRDILGYRPGRASSGLPSGKLSANESAFGPTPAVRAADGVATKSATYDHGWHEVCGEFYRCCET